MKEESELRLLGYIMPVKVDVSATNLAKENPRFLSLWFSHPGLDRQSSSCVTLLDQAGKPLPLAAAGSFSSRSEAAPDPSNGNIGWIIYTLSPGTMGHTPATVTVRLEYGIGPWETGRDIEVAFQGSMALSDGAYFNGFGQSVTGKAVVPISIDLSRHRGMQYDFIALTKDGRQIASRGPSSGGPAGGPLLMQRFEFDSPLDRIKAFRFRTRPIRKVEFPNVSLRPADKPQTLSPPRLKVGVIVSKSTATGFTWVNAPYGYVHAAIASPLQRKEIDLYPIIEPGTGDDPEVARVCRNISPNNKPLDGSKAGQLKTLDVIVSHRASNMRGEVLDAMIEAIRGGVGFLSSSTFGVVTPGYEDPRVGALLLGRPSYYWNSRTFRGKIVASHPILKNGAPGHPLQLVPNGGELSSYEKVNVLAVLDDSEAKPNCPMIYTGQLERGRVVVFSFRWTDPSQLDQNFGPDFLLHCVQWLAAGKSTPAPPSRPADGPQTVSPSKIKVGVIVSTFTATGPHWPTGHYGYSHALIARQLKDPQIDLYAIVEPEMMNSEDATLRNILQQEFPAGHVIDGSSKQALQSLQVIVACRIWNLHNSVLPAVSQAVEDGVGLLDQSAMGVVTPGCYTPEASRLHAMTTPDYFWVPRDVECIVVGDHPLLANLKAKGIKKVTVTHLNGALGRFHGTPLIAAPGVPNQFVGNSSANLPDKADASVPDPSMPPVFYPLYVAQLGKGRIVGCQWYGPQDVSRILNEAHGGRFYIHCVQWLAGKPLK